MPFHEVDIYAQSYSLWNGSSAYLGRDTIETHNGYGFKTFTCPNCHRMFLVKIYERGMWHPLRRMETIRHAKAGAVMTIIAVIMLFAARNGLNINVGFGDPGLPNLVYCLIMIFCIAGGPVLLMTALWDALFCPRRLDGPRANNHCTHIVKFVNREKK